MDRKPDEEDVNNIVRIRHTKLPNCSKRYCTERYCTKSFYTVSWPLRTKTLLCYKVYLATIGIKLDPYLTGHRSFTFICVQQPMRYRNHLDTHLESTSLGYLVFLVLDICFATRTDHCIQLERLSGSATPSDGWSSLHTKSS